MPSYQSVHDFAYPDSVCQSFRVARRSDYVFLKCLRRPEGGRSILLYVSRRDKMVEHCAGLTRPAHGNKVFTQSELDLSEFGRPEMPEIRASKTRSL